MFLRLRKLLSRDFADLYSSHQQAHCLPITAMPNLSFPQFQDWRLEPVPQRCVVRAATECLSTRCGNNDAHEHGSLPRTEVRGVSVQDDLEPVECVHVCIQGTGSHSLVQSHSEAR
jgi:hypothetical protein